MFFRLDPLLSRRLSGIKEGIGRNIARLGYQGGRFIGLGRVYLGNRLGFLEGGGNPGKRYLPRQTVHRHLQSEINQEDQACQGENAAAGQDIEKSLSPQSLSGIKRQILPENR